LAFSGSLPRDFWIKPPSRHFAPNKTTHSPVFIGNPFSPTPTLCFRAPPPPPWRRTVFTPASAPPLKRGGGSLKQLFVVGISAQNFENIHQPLRQSVRNEDGGLVVPPGKFSYFHIVPPPTHPPPPPPPSPAPTSCSTTLNPLCQLFFPSVETLSFKQSFAHLHFEG